MILAGDIGGTHTRLALFEKTGQFSHLTIYPSQSYSDLESIIAHYLSDKEEIIIDIGSFAVAGPIHEGICHVTNLPWIVDANFLKNHFKFPKIFLLNDLEANAYAIETLCSDSLQVIYGKDLQEKGNRAVISPGTGLGEAGIYWDGRRYYPFACEGGHADFAPVGDLQVEFYHYLQRQYDHVSYEFALSGPGLLHIYQFLLDIKNFREEPFLGEQKQFHNFSALITTHGIYGTSEICSQTLDFFVNLLAQEAANCALKFLAYGGVYLGGGIVPRILSKLKESKFLDRYFHKGTFRSLLEKMPLYVIKDDHAALKGAAYYAYTY